MLALDPGDIVVDFVVGQILRFVIVGILITAFEDIAVVNAESRPAVSAKWVLQTELGVPIDVIGARTLVIRGAHSRKLEIVQQGRTEYV